jgi:gluconate 2-dehydrogenase gamma chain
MTRPLSRRDLIKSLGTGIVAGSLTRTVSPQAAEHARALLEAEKTSASPAGYRPKFFSAHQYKTLQELCDAILPAHEPSGGAVEAGAPEFIDLLTSENAEYQLKLGGGMRWLDSVCADRFGVNFIECSADERTQILDAIAYRKNAAADPRLSQGVAFFSLLRNLTADGFFTSKIGIQYLGYVGNTSLAEFPGCPDVPKAQATPAPLGAEP